jgi:MFS family permease
MDTASSSNPAPWYHGITRYQWLVLALASAGWVFDIYEGQIFNITRDQLFAELVPGDFQQHHMAFYKEAFLGLFLLGGAVGGVLFGALADRWGRKPVLMLTILTYSVFSGLTAFAGSLWEIGVLRFLVAVGTGGEWSVAATMVAEVFPSRARAPAGAIFHGSSVLGTWLASLAGLLVGTNWRYAYLLGVIPAILVLIVRTRLVEPPAHPSSTGNSQGFRELWSNPRWRSRALLGLALAAVGLGTFWGVTVAGQNLAEKLLIRNGVSAEEAEASGKFAYGFVETTGGGLGLLAFGPLAARFGRRRTFIGMQLAALVVVPLTCFGPTEYWQLLVLLPLFGFCTLGMHAGFAIYFPELFPGRLRATGAGICFNGGRLAAASVLVFSGWLKSRVDLRLAVTLLGLLFLVGIILVLVLPETKDQPLEQ